MTLGTFSERLGTFEQSAERPRCKSVVNCRKNNISKIVNHGYSIRYTQATVI